MNWKDAVIAVLIVFVILLIPPREKIVYVKKEINISKPLIADFGGCSDSGCILLVFNNGTKRIECESIKLYRDGKFYTTLDKFPDIYGQACDYIDPKKYIRLRTENLCDGTEKLTIVTNFTDSLIPDERLLSFYVSNYLCLEHQYNRTNI